MAFSITLPFSNFKKLWATVSNKSFSISVPEPVPSGVTIIAVASKLRSPFGAFFTSSLGLGSVTSPDVSTCPGCVLTKLSPLITASIYVFPNDSLLTKSLDQFSLNFLLIASPSIDTIVALGFLPNSSLFSLSCLKS